MRLRIEEIGENSVWETVLTVPSADISLDVADGPEIVAPISVKVRAESSKEDVIVLGEVLACVRLSCSRCLNDFDSALASSFEIQAPLRQDSIDISDELRQSLLLALPLKPLCRTDCRGLCTLCGADLNRAACSCVNQPTDNHFVSILKKNWLH